jgi:transposase
LIARREFRRLLGIHRNRVVPSAHTIKTWVRNLEATGSTLKKKGGSVITVPTPENIAVVRKGIERSPHRFALRHSVSLRLSEASVRRILHKYLQFYPYKIQVTHALHEFGYINRVNFCQTFLHF